MDIKYYYDFISIIKVTLYSFSSKSKQLNNIVITQKKKGWREGVIWDMIRKEVRRVKKGIYFNELLRRYVRDREFKNYLGI